MSVFDRRSQIRLGWTIVIGFWASAFFGAGFLLGCIWFAATHPQL